MGGLRTVRGMENTSADSASDLVAPGPDDISLRPRRTAAETAGLAFLAIVVLIVGAFIGLFGPLLAIACDSCQDGVRNPLPSASTLIIFIAQCGVPVAVLGTVIGMFHPRGGARAGSIGLGVLVVLQFAMFLLGLVTT
jgi:hypothetical protein